MIPLVDLGAQYQTIRIEIDDAIRKCVTESNFIKGKDVAKFEEAFSSYIGSKHCLGCANGTDAIEIILKALGIGTGDEVIVPALSWISTAEAVSNVGAEPVFVDICEDTYTLDPSLIENKISERTKAIIPVHLYGCPADMDEILKIAREHSLFVVEDCAQSHGAVYRNEKTGNFGIASAFSFFPSKNLGAFGDSGAIVTNDTLLYEKVRRIANHGQLHTKHKHDITGRNSRLDTLQAAILNVKLSYLDSWNRKRHELALRYIQQLSSSGLLLPSLPEDRTHVFHIFSVRTPERDKLCSIFDENSISWGIHYPSPLPFVEAYSYKHHTIDDFPVALKITNQICSIPIYPEMTDFHMDFICKIIRENF
jgi:dTDP-4-amino-4,6-dideoxygalactose transaminase